MNGAGFEAALTGRCVFGQHAAAHQFFGLLIVGAGGWLCLSGGAWFGIPVMGIGFFWYAVPGHAFIYGPYLFVIVLYEQLRDLFRRDPPQDS